MFILRIIFLFLFCVFLLSCNKNLTEEEKKELWSKAQTTNEIVERSGTKFNTAKNKKLALSDAQNRLRTGGGLLGNKAGITFGGKKDGDENKVANIGMPINPYLWKASLETLSFMPLSSADPFGGTIITDWYTAASNENERCKLNIFINGVELKTTNLKVSSFCQQYKEQRWINKERNKGNDTKIENAILNKAKKLRLNSG